MKKNKIYLYNIFNGNRNWETDVYYRIKKILLKYQIDVKCINKINPELFCYGDILISHQPQFVIKKPGIFTFCEPKEILNRSNRLKFLDDNGFPTMTWIDGEKIKSKKDIFNKWNTNKIIYKKNNSFQSNGVKIVHRDYELPKVKKGDVFCKIINFDSFTYKVDFFHDKILGSYVKETPSILNQNYTEWIKGDNKDQNCFPNQNRRYFHLPKIYRDKLKQIGKIITSMGGGYCSIDLMKSKNGYKAIELNISEIATKYTWQTKPKKYSKNFANGIMNMCNDYSLIKNIARI